MKLTSKQRLFVEEYLVDLNATQAYLRAGYKVSEKVAQANSARVLSNAMVSAAVKDGIEKKLLKIEVTTEKIIQQISIIANGSLSYFLKIDRATGTATIDLSRANNEQLQCIAEYQYEEVIERTGSGTQRVRKVRIKLCDNLRALEMIGKYLKLFSDNHQRVSEEARKILRQVRMGELGPRDAGYEFALLGLPLPEVLIMEILKAEMVTDDNSKPPTTEEIMARAAEMLANVGGQRAEFLPRRREEVEEMKHLL